MPLNAVFSARGQRRRDRGTRGDCAFIVRRSDLAEKKCNESTTTVDP
jgi:hypothetical protein